MKVLLIGAGGQGAPCASILARDPDVSEVIIGDVNKEMAEKVVAKINRPHLRAMALNAANTEEVAQVAGQTDVIIDLVSTAFTIPIMKAALKAGVHYVNSAFSRELWDFDLQVGKKPLLFDEFEKKNLTALLGCGMSAGYTNVIARNYVDRMESVETIRVRLAKKDTSVSEEEEILQPWNPGWNPKIAFMDFVNSTTAFYEGSFATFEKPFSEIERCNFPEPVGEMLVALHAHEEPYSMPTTLAHKGLKNCDFKYYVNKQVAPMVALGFGREKEVEVDGVKVNPLNVLLSLVPNPGEAFLNDDPTSFEYKDQTKHVAILLEISGIEAGKPKTYHIYIPDMNKPRKKIYELFGTTQVNVALPAVIGMKMAVEGTKKGVIFSEELDPQRFIQLIQNTGYPNRWIELDG